VAIVANPNRILNHERLNEIFQYVNITNARELLIYGGIALVVVFLIKNVYILFFKYFEARFIYNRRYLLSHRLMTAYMQAPYTFYLQRNSSELLRNVTQEINLMINSVLNPVMKILKEIIMGTSIVLFLFLVEPLITLIIAVIMGGMSGLFLFFTQKRMKYIGEEAQRFRNLMLKSARQGFGGIKDARVLNREGEFIEVFRDMAYKSSRLQQDKTFISAIPKPVIETLAVAGIMLIALMMVVQNRPISGIVPLLALYSMAILRIMPAIQQITQLITDLRYHLPSINPVYDDLVLLRKSNIEFKADRRKQERLNLNKLITIRNLYFQYPGSSEQALRGVSIVIEHGKSAAFVGASGAGKTTIADLILGLLEPQKGEILVDDKNIFQHISAWQQNIGYIPQFIYLSDDTLRRNIAFGLPDSKIVEEKVQKAVELAQLGEMIMRLPEGLDTVVGERGTRLSGGQRQRVGIARALYNNPQVLVMDEATSALDNVTEQLIIEAIEALKGERTVIMIAHRLTTVMNCDVIFFMENGIVVDQGTYKGLIQSNPRFRALSKEK
ncbi:MAG: ABC transporter ATP-binding protein, partial [Sphingobacteriia bacterium]|nr:ABC transporter ATP-binding protein [Sphingobacteriia bacterium]